MEKGGFVYILASKGNGTIYIGVTANLARRVWEHRRGIVPGFTARYGIKMLVHFERFETIEEAIAREKAVKKWYRAWKLELVERENPFWRDLWPEITGS